MAQLSSRAQAMLARGRRHPTVTEPVEIARYLRQARLPVFEPVVSFQSRYGGLEYSVRGGWGFHFDLFEGLALMEAWEFDAQQDQSGWYFACGSHEAAQFPFYIAHDGALCVGVESGRNIPIATSVEKYIESDALRDDLLAVRHRWWTLSREVAQGDRSLDAIVVADRQRIEVASDRYTAWWQGQHSRVVRLTMLADTATDKIQAFLASRGEAGQLASAIRAVVGTPVNVYSHPFRVEEHRKIR